MDGDKEFRFIGANMPGLVLPYDWTLYLSERLHLPTPWEQEDAFQTLDQMNLRVCGYGTCRSAGEKRPGTVVLSSRNHGSRVDAGDGGIVFRWRSRKFTWSLERDADGWMESSLREENKLV